MNHRNRLNYQAPIEWGVLFGAVARRLLLFLVIWAVTYIVIMLARAVWR